MDLFQKKHDHIMTLSEPFFTKVFYGEKTVEMRLFDEKRRKVRVGDRITFFCAENNCMTLETVVEGIGVFDDFYALAASYPTERLGFAGKSPSEVAEFMKSLYGERAKNCRAVAFEIIFDDSEE